MITIQINNKKTYTYNNFDDITSLNNFYYITYIDCSHNQLTTLPQLQCNSNGTLPNSLQKLYCWNNQLIILQQLPNSLQELYCNSNQLTTLPQLQCNSNGTLPNSLQELYCEYNQLTALPQLPNSLQRIVCSHNQLTILPQLPNSLRYLICNNNLFKIKYTKSKHKYNIKTKKNNNDKQFINDVQCGYLDSSYHPRKTFCIEKLMFSYDYLFSD